MTQAAGGEIRTPFIPWQSKMLLGLFIPIQNGGWSPSLASRTTDWSFEYNLKCTRQAEAFGFDFVFGLGQWHKRGGYGGLTNYHEQHIDPLVVSAGLAAATSRIGIISTTHVLYGWHPTLLAKLSATIDHMSAGRFGLNIVTGYKPFEFEMFGQDPVPHDDRYLMAEEFTEQMQNLWAAEDDITTSGRFWSMRNAFVTPKPKNQRPTMVSAGSSAPGLEFARKFSDMLFITSPVYPGDIYSTIDALPDYIRKVRRATEREGARLRLLINPLILCRETQKEVDEYYEMIAGQPDIEAINALVGTMTASGDHESWKGAGESRPDAASLGRQAAGGNVLIVGTPDVVAKQIEGLYDAGVDGVQLSFFDYLPDLKFFGERVLPILRRDGYRQ